MDKAVTMNKVEQALRALQDAKTNNDLDEVRGDISQAEALLVQIRQQIRKA